MNKNIKIGILGGGQLALMLTEAAFKLGIQDITVLDPTENCPAQTIGAKQIIGSFTDKNKIIELASKVDVLTFDIESINIDALFSASEITKVYPSPNCLSIIQNKYLQNCFLKDLSIPIPKFYKIEDMPLSDNNEIIIKAKKGGYDGKGVWKIYKEDLPDLMERLNIHEDNIFAEELIDIKKELAIIAYLSHDQQVICYPIVETIQKDGICTEVICPVSLDISIRLEIIDITEKIVQKFQTKGIIAIEFFLTSDNRVLVNEISPRVHNSGHYTIEGTNCSQFEQHIRSIVGLPNIKPYYNYYIPIIMKNILGTGKKMDYTNILTKSGLHWYNKKSKDGIYKLNRKIGHYTQKINIIHCPYPLVYIIMGSSSDYKTMEPAIDLFKYYYIPYKVDIVSAHRSPEWMYEFGKNIESWCCKVIIAGAGGAAHLPGMMASLTPIPVIGVPVPTQYLGGKDSLLSIVQMPDGVPVATVGIGKAKNAAILATKIMGITEVSNVIMIKNRIKVDNQRSSYPISQ